MNPITPYSNLFSARLHKACDERGLASNQLARVRQLAADLELDPVIVSTLLSGSAMPEWQILFRLCELFSKQPGYFLDIDPQALPGDAITAKTLTSGSGVVIRTPSVRRGAMSMSANAQRFRYLRTTAPMGFGVISGDTLITLEINGGSDLAVPNHHYLIKQDHAYELRMCSKSKTGSMILVADPSVSDFPELPVTQNFEGYTHFGHVECLVREALSSS